jgi:serine/threonine protein kinase
MELVSGSTMRSELRRCGVIAPLIAADWFDQLLSGLEFAHSAGIVHRDLKPENVLIVSQGQNGCGVKLVDFGVAKLRSLSGAPTTCITEAGLVLGTLGYMSPEQLNGMEPDERSDVYSVGVMVAEVLTGKLLPPRDAGDVVGQFCAAFGAGGARLGNVIASCLAFDRSDRFQTATSLRAGLKEALLTCSAGL